MGFATIGSLFGLGGSAGGGAQAAQNQNAYQQYLIDTGTQDVNAIFGGGTSAPQYFAAGGAPTAGVTYYKGHHGRSPGGETFSYVPVGKVGKNTKGLFTQVPGQSYTGFTPGFYDAQVNAYEQFANPQLGGQYNQALQSLQGGFAGQGLLNSSAYRNALSNLNTTYGQQQQQIIDTGNRQAQNLQGEVENARQAALGQLYQTANPSQAGLTALNLASQVQAPSAYAPLGNAFSSILGNLALQQAYNNYPQLGYNAPATYNYGANAGAIPTNESGQPIG